MEERLMNMVIMCLPYDGMTDEYSANLEAASSVITWIFIAEMAVKVAGHGVTKLAEFRAEVAALKDAYCILNDEEPGCSGVFLQTTTESLVSKIQEYDKLLLVGNLGNALPLLQ